MWKTVNIENVDRGKLRKTNLIFLKTKKKNKNNHLYVLFCLSMWIIFYYKLNWNLRTLKHQFRVDILIKHQVVWVIIKKAFFAWKLFSESFSTKNYAWILVFPHFPQLSVLFLETSQTNRNTQCCSEYGKLGVGLQWEVFMCPLKISLEIV